MCDGRWCTWHHYRGCIKSKLKMDRSMRWAASDRSSPESLFYQNLVLTFEPDLFRVSFSYCSCCQNSVLTFAPLVLVSLVRRPCEPVLRSGFLSLFFLPAHAARSASSRVCISFWLVLPLIFLWFPHSAHAKVRS
jgi:hypothetical protein